LIIILKSRTATYQDYKTTRLTSKTSEYCTTFIVYVLSSSTFNNAWVTPLVELCILTSFQEKRMYYVLFLL